MSTFFANDLLLAILYLFYNTGMGLNKSQVHPIIFEFKMGCTATPNINSTLGPETATNASTIGSRGEVLQVVGQTGQQQKEHSLTALAEGLDSVPSTHNAQLSATPVPKNLTHSADF